MKKTVNSDAKVEAIIEAIELELIEYTGGTVDEKKSRLPLTKDASIKALIWNLLSSNKWREQISYNDYLKIIDIWISRLKN